MNKNILHNLINNIENVLIDKNDRYGDSFYKSLDKHGNKAFEVRIEDKINRMSNLFQNSHLSKDTDESLEDTIMDIAGYCILYLTYKKERIENG